MRAGIRVASLQLRAASRLRSASVARRVPSLARAPHPARAMASSPQRGASGAASTPYPVALGASAAAPGSPRSVAVAAATAEASPANPLLSDDLFPRFSEVRRPCRRADRHATSDAAPTAALCGAVSWWP
jgi:hypothetical protein